EVIILAIPFFAAEDVLPTLAEQIADRIVIDATNPLNDDWSPRLLGQENSAAEEIARLLPDAKLVKAFNTIFADIMSESGFDRHGQKATLFIAGDDEVAVATVAGLASDMGLLPVRTGALTTARYLEAMAHLNIAIAVGQSGGTNAAFVYHRA
ncbi:MAG: NADP oxidoreductase, partial [Pseudomonadota bacterium]